MVASRCRRIEGARIKGVGAFACDGHAAPQINGGQDEASHQDNNVGRRYDDRFREHSRTGTEPSVYSGPGVRARNTGSL